MSGDPTVGEVDAMLQNAVDVLQKNYTYGNGTLIAALDTLEQSVEGDDAPAGLVGEASTARAIIASSCSGRRALGMLLPILREYGKLAGSRHTRGNNLRGLLHDVYRYWVDNTKTVETRAITYTTPSASGSNTGSGLLSRLTVDAENEDLEACHVEAKAARCVSDQNTGQRRHGEVFNLFGANPGLDSLEVSGSGLTRRLPCRHAGTDPAGGSLLQNSSFQTYDSSLTTTKFAGWTLDSNHANATQDTTDAAANYFRSFPGDPASSPGRHSLKLSGLVVATQKLSVTNRRLNRNVPYFLRIMYNRATGSGAQTLEINLGSQTVQVVLSAQTGWNELVIAVDQNSWYENFAEDELDITVEITSHTSGYTLVDDMILAPMTQIDGTWWILRGGVTPFMAANASLPLGDQFTMTDTGGAAATGKINYWWWRAFNASLPSDASPSVADP